MNSDKTLLLLPSLPPTLPSLPESLRMYSHSLRRCCSYMGTQTAPKEKVA